MASQRIPSPWLLCIPPALQWSRSFFLFLFSFSAAPFLALRGVPPPRASHTRTPRYQKRRHLRQGRPKQTLRTQNMMVIYKPAAHGVWYLWLWRWRISFISWVGLKTTHHNTRLQSLSMPIGSKSTVTPTSPLSTCSVGATLQSQRCTSKSPIT